MKVVVGYPSILPPLFLLFFLSVSSDNIQISITLNHSIAPVSANDTSSTTMSLSGESGLCVLYFDVFLYRLSSTSSLPPLSILTPTHSFFSGGKALLNVLLDLLVLAIPLG